MGRDGGHRVTQVMAGHIAIVASTHLGTASHFSRDLVIVPKGLPHVLAGRGGDTLHLATTPVKRETCWSPKDVKIFRQYYRHYVTCFNEIHVIHLGNSILRTLVIRMCCKFFFFVIYYGALPQIQDNTHYNLRLSQIKSQRN